MSRHLVALDGSRSAETALPYAVAAARALNAELHLVRVLEPAAPSEGRPTDSVAWRLARAEAVAYLQSWKARLEEQGFAVSYEVREGVPAEQVLEAAREQEIDLVALAARGGGGLDVGGTTQRIVAAGTTSLLVVRGADSAAPLELDACCARVVVPVDGSRRGDWALSVGTSIARARGGRLAVAHVVPVPELVGSVPPPPEDVRLRDRLVLRNRREAEAYLERVRENLSATPLDVVTRLVVAPGVARTLATIAREEAADIVVLCAHGGGCPGEGVAAPYGSVATGLLALDTPPLLVLQDVPRGGAVPLPTTPSATPEPVPRA